MKLAVVILNWNGKRFLEQFLPSLIKYSPEYAEIIIADNASSDDSIAFLNAEYPKLRIIQNQQNGGFSKGYNDALKQIDATYYCLLNSDIEVTEYWIEPIIDLMDSDAQIAVCQPKILAYHRRNEFEYAGACGGFIDKLGYPFCRGRLFNSIEKDCGQYDDIAEIFWATGAAMFVRADIYHKLGGLDEDFFAHQEEIDFCWRVKNHGYKVKVCPQSKVYHIGGGTLPKNNARKTYLNFRNNLWLVLKNLPKSQLFSALFYRFFLDLLAAVVFLLKGQFRDFSAVIKAYFSFISRFNTMKCKRQPNLKPLKDIYPKSIVWMYFVKKIKTYSGLRWRKI